MPRSRTRDRGVREPFGNQWREANHRAAAPLAQQNPGFQRRIKGSNDPRSALTWLYRTMNQDQGRIQFKGIANMSSYRKTANRITQLK